MVKSNSWCDPRINIRVYLVQHFHKWFTFLANEADFCNFADDAIIYKCGRDLELVSHELEMDANIAKKVQIYFLARNQHIKMEMSFAGKTKRSLYAGELLGVTFEYKLSYWK